MSLKQTFSTFSIRKKIRTLMWGFLAVQTILTIFMIFNDLGVQANVRETAKIKTEMMTIKDLKSDTVALTLVAMDTIVDKEDGVMAEERVTEANSLKDDGLQKFATVAAILSRNPTDGMNTGDLQKDYTTLHKVIAEDLKAAVANRASPEEFAKFDDAIDGNASVLIEKLDKIEKSAEADMNQIFAETQQSTDLLLLYVAFQFIVTLCLLWAMTNFIDRQIVTPLSNQIDQTLNAIKLASTDLKMISGELMKSAHTTEDHSAHGASASNQASSNVQNVASASEELSISIAEIRRQVQLSSEVSKLAVSEAENATGVIQKLDQFAHKIGEIVTTITAIAEKTNLLALNATIESARAGEMGKGFAVVASEVKNLATQTSSATDEISTQISEMQNLVKNAVAAIGNIKDTIVDIDNASSGIMSSISQQTAATGEISRGLNEASTGVQESSRLMDTIAQSVRVTRGDIDRVGKSIEGLEQRMQSARTEVDNVLYGKDAA